MILYLHGFRSSPQSFKARVLAERMQQLGRGHEYYCPQLPASPREAIDLASALTKQCAPDQLTVIGSSLGGYYANWMAEQLGCRAVLLNPAIYAVRDLATQVGVSTAYHSDQPFEFKREYIDELKQFTVDAITQPARYFLIAASGDEVLDSGEMVAHYVGAKQQVIAGSDHALSDFEDYVDAVLAFCDSTTWQRAG